MSSARQSRAASNAIGAIALLAVACSSLTAPLRGRPGPETGLVRGRAPSSARGATHADRLTDGIAAEPGDGAVTDLTTVLAGPDAFVIYDLGAVSPASLAALAYLVVFGSIVAFTAYGWLLNNVGTQLLSTYAYVNPAVAVLLGWAFIGERIGGKEIAAGLVILASVAMLFFARESRAAEPTPESLDAYIRSQEAQAAEVRPTPSLAELRRIPA